MSAKENYIYGNPVAIIGFELNLKTAKKRRNVLLTKRVPSNRLVKFLKLYEQVHVGICEKHLEIVNYLFTCLLKFKQKPAGVVLKAGHFISAVV